MADFAVDRERLMVRLDAMSVNSDNDTLYDDTDDCTATDGLLTTSPQPQWRQISKMIFQRPLPLLKDTTVAGILAVILPSFIGCYLVSDIKKVDSTKRISNIATLDGLRGISCLFVMHLHWTAIITDSYRGITGALNAQYFFHLPFVHLLWHGAAQVDIFFVLSGYVISVKCLKQIHERSWDAFHKTIASSVFRRAIRIYLPPLISLVLYAVLVRFGAYARSQLIWMHEYYFHSLMVEMKEVTPPLANNAHDQIWNLMGAMLDLLDPAFPMPLAGRWASYNGHLWTIPQEYYCSMALFCVLLGTSRLRRGYRLACHVALVTFCWFTYHRVHCLFFAGMTIAEFDLLFSKYERQCCVVVRGISVLTAVRTTILVFGLYLLSCPRYAGESTPGYSVFFTMMPTYLGVARSQDLIRGLGAMLTVWSISNISTDTRCAEEDEIRKAEQDPAKWYVPSLRQVVVAALANPVARYLGRISFSLYILHGMVIKSLGYNIIPIVYNLVISNPARHKSLEGYAMVEWVNGAWRPKIQPTSVIQSTAVAATAANATPVSVTAAVVEAVTNTVAATGPVLRKRVTPTWDGTRFVLYTDDKGLTAAETAAIWILGYLILVPIIIWAADLFTRAVDERCVELGKTVERWMALSNDENPRPQPGDTDSSNNTKGLESVTYHNVREMHETHCRPIDDRNPYHYYNIEEGSGSSLNYTHRYSQDHGQPVMPMHDVRL